MVYGAINRKDWRTVSADDIAFEPRERRNQLVPTLRPETLGGATAPIAWARSLNDECRDALRVVLPLAEAESEFLERLLDHGEIVPALLTNDPALGERIAAQPMLAWKTLNVGRHKDNKQWRAVAVRNTDARSEIRSQGCPIASDRPQNVRAWADNEDSSGHHRTGTACLSGTCRLLA